jgi:hypothetical protein
MEQPLVGHRWSQVRRQTLLSSQHVADGDEEKLELDRHLDAKGERGDADRSLCRAETYRYVDHILGGRRSFLAKIARGRCLR